MSVWYILDPGGLADYSPMTLLCLAFACLSDLLKSKCMEHTVYLILWKTAKYRQHYLLNTVSATSILTSEMCVVVVILIIGPSVRFCVYVVVDCMVILVCVCVCVCECRCHWSI